MQVTTNVRIRQQFSFSRPGARALPRPRRCPVAGCDCIFHNNSGLTQHKRLKHPEYLDEPSSDNITSAPATLDIPDTSSDRGVDSDKSGSYRATVEDVEDEDEIRSSSRCSGEAKESRTRRHYHPHLNGAICDEDGNFLPAHAPPPPRHDPKSTDCTS
ncbi:hypothetical protein HWV62_43644, partial [Athelia sp. TMB]